MIQAFQQVFQNQDFVADLGAAHQRGQGPVRLSQSQAQGLDLALSEQSHRGRQVSGYPNG